MEKIKLVEIGDTTRAMFECPGCGYAHYPTVKGDKSKTPVWDFNNDLENPTLKPSVRVEGEFSCHSFITGGKIAFLGDCTHNLKEQTVELPACE